MMNFRVSRATGAISALIFIGLLGACAEPEGAWPSLDAENRNTNAAAATGANPYPAGTPVGGRPALAQARVIPAATPGAPTGTFVGQKIGQLRGDLIALQSQVQAQNNELAQVRNETVQTTDSYHAAIAGINSRLQAGTTPGNPELIQQWNQAQAQLDRLSADIARMNNLSTAAAASSAQASYIRESVRSAYTLSGAIEEDHRQLAVLEDDVNRTVVEVDRLLFDISQDINRQTLYLSGEQRNMMALSLAIKNGEMYGASLGNRAVSPLTPGSPQANAVAGQRPLVVIRFDRNDVSYEQALYTAASQALERKPDAVFTVVAVSPAQGTAAQVALNANNAKRQAERVYRSLTNMGMPSARITMTQTPSPAVNTNEIHVYVR